MVPPNWRGSLPITYHVGGGDGALVHMAVKSDWPLKTIYNVVAVMKGSTYPDQWIMRGNHHDGWVFGAADPMSGHIAMMGEAKAIGALAKTGWRPKRTLVYFSWDAEEPMLLGSTEWAETHAAELKEKGLVYVNSDGSGRGFLNVRGQPFPAASRQSRRGRRDRSGNRRLGGGAAAREDAGRWHRSGRERGGTRRRAERPPMRRATCRSEHWVRVRTIRPSCSIWELLR